ncbi:Gfo/Idh/MocA family oxidoreductase [Ruegeria sp. 2205SS24-7]|uniref:Gfo/Idh/MocA family protein n=1 Tax=Ruegeria discodermiae TaxID=3064389 RepID=UPI00274196B8|nr:Gfo/Idh/MocA family oxidoreductase [Ruegeria sp. 2205SS24-7]MDP5220217.1 Gfo/Idh/MocA family oxidoreductase [Ruegeria sp. 2205SS24-7]
MGETPKSFRVGLIGTGRISDIYLTTLGKYPQVDIVACGSLDLEESRAKAQRYGVPRVAAPQEILADPDIDGILNLTIPAAHADVSMAALEAGKHVYSEKPLVSDLADGQRILDLATVQGLCVGNAPDTFLGVRWQTLRKLLDEGRIGTPTGCAAFVGTHGTERHNPNPDFYYQTGGGPMLDLGPYYLTAMVFLLGPIARVAGMANRAFDRRMIETGPRNGEWMAVEVDTHVQGLLEFSNGAAGTITMSFDIWDSEMPRFEVYGTEGTICIPDPDPVHGANIFQGEVWYRTRDTARWTHQPRPAGRDTWQIADTTHGLNEDSRGIGLIEMADAIAKGRVPRCSGALAYHVLEVMTGILQSPASGRYVTINSRPPVPDILPENFPES